MHIVPVIDIRHGVAVHARGGDRASYEPLNSPLAASSDPIALARSYLRLFPFGTLYIADLDGIEGRGVNIELRRRLLAATPETEWWIDDGSRLDEGSGHLLSRPRPRPIHVLGSETMVSSPHPNPLPACGEGEQFLLSLDFRGDEFLGPKALLDDPSHWPDRVIVMTLSNVGGNAGPDLARIGEIASRAGSRKIYAAGGIRDRRDVEVVRAAGATGALIASALHAGTIKAADLIEIAGL